MSEINSTHMWLQWDGWLVQTQFTNQGKRVIQTQQKYLGQPPPQASPSRIEISFVKH